MSLDKPLNVDVTLCRRSFVLFLSASDFLVVSSNLFTWESTRNLNELIMSSENTNAYNALSLKFGY